MADIGGISWNILVPDLGWGKKIRGLAWDVFGCFLWLWFTVIDCDWRWSRMNVDEEWWAACDWQILGFWTPFPPTIFLRFRVRSRGLGELDPLCFPGFRKMIVHNNSQWISYEFPMNFLWIPMNFHSSPWFSGRSWQVTLVAASIAAGGERHRLLPTLGQVNDQGTAGSIRARWVHENGYPLVNYGKSLLE